MTSRSTAQPRLAALPLLIASALGGSLFIASPQAAIAATQALAQVSGSVTDHAGAPLAGVAITVMGVSEAVYDQSHKLVSDSSGRFAVSLPAGDYGVMADHPGFDSYSASNFSIIRKMSLNLLRQDKICKIGVKGKRLRCGWDDKYLFNILSQA